MLSQLEPNLKCPFFPILVGFLEMDLLAAH
jgi:hypothetical protein